MKKISFKVMRYEVRYWRFLFAGGLLFSFLGIWILFSSDKSQAFLDMLVALGLFATGSLEILFSLVNRRVVSDWKAAAIGGFVDFALGCYLLAYPTLSPIVIPLIIALWILIRAIFTISREVNSHALQWLDFLWIFIAAICMVFPAIIILLDPLVGLLHITKLAGAAFVLSGIFRVIFSLHLRKLARMEKLP